MIDFTGKITDFHLKIINRKDFDEAIAKLNDCEIEGTIRKKKRYRSLSQNKYYWACTVAMIQEGMKEQGNDFDALTVHEFLKARFNYKEVVNEKTGEVLMFGQSTTELSTSEFMDYLAKCSQFAQEYLNIVIPEPGSQSSLDFVNND